nr:immunoglobulin light chain junction region [Macaca mulatta]MOX51631.1 immunoglobulin light chain junction region [Macaca mulatta]MOX52798.1 immunoglobulin light chain junction region [Macaca mulatta]MOX55206.1 immunoglobulin light chain junction region [Macaca mulatta]MOX55327.1 immunoglobulin light chain junction region [Macaca mulatta]
CHHTYGTPFTF